MSNIPTIPYIKYDDLENFYSIKEICNLFQVEKDYLKAKCKKFNIMPHREAEGSEKGLSKWEICRLHNLLYYENREKPAKPQAEKPRNIDPWDEAFGD